MGAFKTIRQTGITFVTDEAANFYMKVEISREITEQDCGTIIVGTIANALTPALPTELYVFELIDEYGQPDYAPSDAAALLMREAVEYFFRSTLDTDCYLSEIPEFSTLFVEEFEKNDGVGESLDSRLPF
jgi:hypothetical protein